jgi:3-oxoacyl-[acyl-carrier protein] reductase
MNVLITGGASGLGEAITRRVAANKTAKVYFTFSASESAARKIEAEFTNTTAIKCDFRDEKELERFVEKVEGLDLDALINNAYAGYFTKSHFHKTAASDFLTEFKENIYPTLLITQAALQGFRKKKKGRIISILSSALLKVPPAGAAVYTANKAYLQQMVKVWAAENSKFNISSNSISPSFMLTNIHKDMDERMVEQLRENHPHKKFLTPAEVAEAVIFLLDASPQMNGADIVINAGTSIK